MSDNKPELVVEIASLSYGCGRAYLDVSEIVVAMEGDPCRHMLPANAAQEIPKDELERSMIGDQKATDVPIEIVRFFRGQPWDEKAIAWAAKTINADVQKKVTAAVARREAEIVAWIRGLAEAYEQLDGKPHSFRGNVMTALRIADDIERGDHVKIQNGGGA